MLFTQTMNQNADFQRLYRCGAFCSLGSALLYVRPNKLPYNRLGITAGKKIGNAVKRNRAKRIIRAAYSAAEPMLPIGLDIVVVARSSLPEQSAVILTERFCANGVRHCSGVSSGEIPCTQNQSFQKRKKKRRTFRKTAMRLLRRVFIAPIRFYQRHISPHFPAVCRFRPSCSAYAVTAIDRFGVIPGIWLGALRILRCNPFSEGGWDPVPLQFDLLGRHKIPQPDPLSPAQRHALEYQWLLAHRTKWRGIKRKYRPKH